MTLGCLPFPWPRHLRVSLAHVNLTNWSRVSSQQLPAEAVSQILCGDLPVPVCIQANEELTFGCVDE